MKRGAIFFLIFCMCFSMFMPTTSVFAASGTTQTSTKTTKKVTTKKETMKKAATKTATTTKRTTTNKESIKKNGSITIITDTKVVTTVKTSTKKKSKTKIIETTVVTTVKTTKIASTNSTSTGSSTETNTDFTITKFSDIKGHVNQKVYDAFNTLGFTLKINSALSTTGSFSASSRNIQLKRGNSSYLLHELGHFFSAVKGHSNYLDQTDTFKSIYNAEKNAYIGNNKAYVTNDTGEYFAESFYEYSVNPSVLKNRRPRTYDYINNAVTSFSDSDIMAFRNTFSYMWR